MGSRSGAKVVVAARRRGQLDDHVDAIQVSGGTPLQRLATGQATLTTDDRMIATATVQLMPVG